MIVPAPGGKQASPASVGDAGGPAARSAARRAPYHVAAGHIIKLELLPNDAPYGRANPTSPDTAAQHPVVVDDLMLRLPVLEEPRALRGLVEVAGPKVVPPGYQLAPDVPPVADDPKC